MSRDPGTNLLPALLALVSEPAWIIDSDNRIVALNAPAAELFGLERQAALGRLLTRHIDPVTIANLRRTVLENDQVAVEIACENHQGQSFPMTCKVTMEQSYLLMVTKEVGNPPGDPTTGLLAEELLRQSPDAILVTDLHLRILRWLGSAEQLFGYSAEEVTGRTTEFLMSPDVLTARMPEFQRQLREGGVFRGELPVLHKDGHRLIVDVTAKVIYDDAGQPTGILGINRDVTERRQAEHELRRSEASYRTLLEYLPAGVLVHSPTTELLFCNRAAQQILGIVREQVLGAHVTNPSWTFFTVEGVKLNVEDLPLQRVLRTRQAVTDVVTRIEKPDGSSSRWIVINAYPELDPSGGVRHVVVTFIDITTQKQTMEDLRRNRDMLALAQRIAHIGHWELDIPGERAEWSEEMFRIFEMTPDEFARRPDAFLERVHPDDRDRLSASFESALKGDFLSYTEFRLLLPGGNEKYVRSHATASEIVADQPTHLVGTIQDVTEIHDAVEALRGSEARYRSIIQDQTEFVVRWLPGGIRTFVNDAYCRFARQTREEILGTSFFPRLPIEIRDEFHEGLAELTPDSPIRHGERNWVSDSGQTYWTEWTDRAIFDSRGHLLEYQSVGRDVTQQRLEQESRRQLELQIQHAQKLESLGILAGGIAHDFNNLLTGILGNASLAMMDLVPGSAADQCLQQIETICLRAAELCKQMLAYSGKGQFVVEPIDLSTLVREMGNLLRVSINKNVSIQYRLDNRLPKILADASQIRQVVMNLITNASEAIGDANGTVTITIQSVWADRQTLASTYIDQDLSPGNYVLLQVSDTGSGMSEETQAKLFDPFFTTKFTGRGLGLAAVLGIIRGHRGAIRVDTEPGTGSTFTIYLPAAAPENPVNTAETDDRPELAGSGTVLVIDDEEYIRVISERMLTPAGFKVQVAADGRAGLEAFKLYQQEISVIILDMTMPRMGGAETFREIRKIDPEARVILSSGFTEQEAIRRFSEGGIRGFLQKPYRRKELLSAVRAALEDAP